MRSPRGARPLEAAGVAAVAMLAGCNPPPPEAAVERYARVEARITAQTSAGQAQTKTLTLERREAGSAPRVAYTFAPGLAEVTAADLRIVERSGDPFAERYVLAVMQPPPAPPNGFSVSEAPGWARGHTGRLGLAVLQTAGGAGPVEAHVPPTVTGHDRAGASWLFRIEDDDHVSRWRTDPEGPCNDADPERTFFARPDPDVTDCFDLETVAAALLGNLAVEVGEALAVADLPVALSAGEHALHLVPALVLANPAQSGFAFLYQATVEMRQGPVKGRAIVRVPLQFVFTRFAGPNAPAVAIVPFAPVSTAEDLEGRVAVDYGAPPNVPFLNATFAEQLRDRIVERLASRPPPTVPTVAGEVDLGEALGYHVFGSGQSVYYPENFAVALLPADLTRGFADTLLFRTSVVVQREEGDAVSLSQDLTGQRVVDVLADGKIARTTYLDANGKTRRVVYLSPFEPGEEVDLWLLR